MIDILNILLTDSFWAASLRIATPLIFGVLGALICERSGTLNLGIEGIFVVGAMCGWMATWLGAGLWGGILVAFLCGAFFGLIHALLTVPLGLSQHVSGLGITLFATSVSYFTYRTALPDVSSPPRIEPFQPLDIPILSDLPFIWISFVPANCFNLACFNHGIISLVCAESHKPWIGNKGSWG